MTCWWEGSKWFNRCGGWGLGRGWLEGSEWGEVNVGRGAEGEVEVGGRLGS